MNYNIYYPRNSKNDASAADTANGPVAQADAGKLAKLPCDHTIRVYKEGRFSCDCDRQYIAVGTIV